MTTVILIASVGSCLLSVTMLTGSAIVLLKAKRKAEEIARRAELAKTQLIAETREYLAKIAAL